MYLGLPSSDLVTPHIVDGSTLPIQRSETILPSNFPLTMIWWVSHSSFYTKYMHHTWLHQVITIGNQDHEEQLAVAIQSPEGVIWISDGSFKDARGTACFTILAQAWQEA